MAVGSLARKPPLHLLDIMYLDLGGVAQVRQGALEGDHALALFADNNAFGSGPTLPAGLYAVGAGSAPGGHHNAGDGWVVDGLGTGALGVWSGGAFHELDVAAAITAGILAP